MWNQSHCSETSKRESEHSPLRRLRRSTVAIMVSGMYVVHGASSRFVCRSSRIRAIFTKLRLRLPSLTTPAHRTRTTPPRPKNAQDWPTPGWPRTTYSAPQQHEGTEKKGSSTPRIPGLFLIPLFSSGECQRWTSPPPSRFDIPSPPHSPSYSSTPSTSRPLCLGSCASCGRWFWRDS